MAMLGQFGATMYGQYPMGQQGLPQPQGLPNTQFLGGPAPAPAADTFAGTPSTGQADLMPVLQMMVSMMQMMMSMMSTMMPKGGKAHGPKTETPKTETPGEVVDVTGDKGKGIASKAWAKPDKEVEFNHDSSIEARQHSLLYGLDPKLDVQIDILDTTDPKDKAAETALGEVKKLWTAAKGDPKSLNEYIKLQTLRGMNTEVAALSKAEPKDQAAIDKIMESRTTLIDEIKTLQGGDVEKKEDKVDEKKEDPEAKKAADREEMPGTRRPVAKSKDVSHDEEMAGAGCPNK